MQILENKKLTVNNIDLLELFQRDEAIFTSNGGIFYMFYDELCFLINNIKERNMSKVLEIGVAGGLTSSFINSWDIPKFLLKEIDRSVDRINKNERNKSCKLLND